MMVIYQNLAEIYEALVGADGMERYTHAELIEYIRQLKTIEEEQGTVYTGDAPSTEASFYKKTFVGISETEYKKSEVEDLDNQSYSEGEEYGNE